MRKLPTNRALREIVEEYIAKGWTYSRGNGHGKLTSPCGRRHHGVSVSPSDHRAPHQLRAKLKRLEREAAELQAQGD